MNEDLHPTPKAIEEEPEQAVRDILDSPKVDPPAGLATLRSTSYDNSLEAIGADNFRGAAKINIGDDNLRGKDPRPEEDRQE